MIFSGRRLAAGFTALALGAMLAPLSIQTAEAGDAEAGKATYTATCLPCHGANGDGDTPIGKSIGSRDFSTGEYKFDTDGDGTTGSDADLAAVIKNGAAAYGGPSMPPQMGLSDEDIANVIAYIRTFKK